MTIPVVPPIEDADRHQVYETAASTSTLDLDYPLFGDDSDLEIFVDDVQQTSGWTLGRVSGGSVALATQPIEDGRITFSPAIASGKTISVFYRRQGRRETQATAGGIGRREFNLAISDLVASQRELRRDAGRTLQRGDVADGAGKYAYSAGGHRISNVKDPVDDQDAATKDWVTGQIGDAVFDPASYTGTLQDYIAARTPQNTITLLSEGGVGDNDTDNVLVFDDVSTAYAGYIVDLSGLTFYTSDTDYPRTVQFINGAIRTAEPRYHNFPKQPFAHPLQGDFRVVNTSTDTHYFNGAIGVIATTTENKIIRAFTEGYRHTVSPGSPLIFVVTSNGADEIARIVAYCETLYQPSGVVGGMMNTTDFGCGFLVQDSAGASVSMLFRWFDPTDTTLAITEETITSDPGACFFPHGSPYLDSNGDFYIFGFSGSAANMDINYAKRTAAGSWSLGVVKHWSNAGSIAEVAHARHPDGRWYFVVRDDDGSQASLYGFTASSDFATTTAWVDTNVTCERNPPQLIYEWGYFHFYVQARETTTIDGWENKLLHLAAPADDVMDSGGVVSDAFYPYYSVVASFGYFGLGYLDVCRLPNGRWIGQVLDAETLLGSDYPLLSQILLIGGDPVPVASGAVLKQRRTRPPINENATYWRWTRGASNTAPSGSSGFGADGHLIFAPSADVTITQVEILGSALEPLNKILPWNPIYAQRLESAIGGSGRRDREYFYGYEKVMSLSNRVVTVTAVMSGSFPESSPAGLRAVIGFDPGSGGSGSAEKSANFRVQEMQGGFSVFTATMNTPDADGLTFGTDPFVYFDILFNNAGVLDIYMLAKWMDFGDTYIPLDPPDFNAEELSLSKRVRKLTWGAAEIVSAGRSENTTDFRGPISFGGEMDVVPAVSFADSTDHTDVLISGSIAGTSGSFTKISKREAQLLLGTAGPLTALTPYWCQTAASTGALSILVDTGR